MYYYFNAYLFVNCIIISFANDPANDGRVMEEEVCGTRPLDNFKHERIVGGQDAFYGQVPWQVLIIESKLSGLMSFRKCGGVLISNKWVLTAAHCRAGVFGSLQVALAAYSLGPGGPDFNNGSFIINAKQTIVHNGFNANTFENDLALIELESSVEFGDDIQPVCLPPYHDNYTHEYGFVSGWGELSYRSGSLPTILQIVEVLLLQNSDCQSMFRKAGYNRSIPLSQVCAGFPYGGKDACDGDSGGPLTSRNHQGRWVLIGIVSNGIRCAEPNLPGIYTRISSYLDWINNITMHASN